MIELFLIDLSGGNLLFTFSIKEIEERQLEINLNGDLDIEATETIEENLLPQLTNFKQIEFKFNNVPFVDSSGIGLLLNVVQTLKELGTEVTITQVQKEVMEVFELLQIPEIVGENVFV